MLAPVQAYIIIGALIISWSLLFPAFFVVRQLMKCCDKVDKVRCQIRDLASAQKELSLKVETKLGEEA